MRKILAIDDNKDNLISLEAIINYSFPDVSFISALDGHTGIDLAVSEDPDVILLDIVMPKMDGYEVCRRLKLDENTKNIPVVFLTAIKGDKESRIKALEVGAEAFLTKPIDETELVAQIRAMVKIKDANRQNLSEKEHLALLVAERTSELEKSNITAQKLVEKLRSENESRKKSEKSLMESEQNLVKGQQIAHMGYWKLYPKTGEIIGAEELLKIFEIRSKELSLDSFAAIVHPEDREFDLAHINKGIELGKSWDIEHRLLFEDGRIKWVHAIGNPSLDKNKNVDFISGIVQDITKQKLTDEKLRESEARYARVIDGTNDGIWDWNVITNEDYLSPRWKELLGFTDNELNNEYDTFFSRVHPDDIPRVEAAIQDHLEREIPYNIEHRLRTKSGSYKWFNVRGKADRDEKGKAIHMSGSITDITKRKLAEERLKISEVFLNETGKMSKVGGWTLDFKTGISTWTEATFSLFEVEFNREAPRLPEGLSFYIPESEAILGKAVELARKKGIPYDLEVELITTKGNHRWARTIGKANYLNGKVVGISGTIQNITEQKKVEEEIKKRNKELFEAKEKAEESDLLKSAFLANMSHEIRTPMNGIMGFTDLLEDPDTSQDERKRYTSIVRSSGERLLELMNNLIDYSKSEAGQMMVSKTNVDITEIFDRLDGMFHREIEIKKIDLTFHNESQQRHVFTDLNFFESILINLIKNAIKFTDQGFIKVNCKKDNGGLIFCVQDTGIGVLKENINSIFDRFNQEDNSLTKKFEGAGLGLAISKSYIELLGGKIWAESELGKGSTFYFTIPFQNTES